MQSNRAKSGNDGCHLENGTQMKSQGFNSALSGVFFFFKFGLNQRHVKKSLTFTLYRLIHTAHGRVSCTFLFPPYSLIVTAV